MVAKDVGRLAIEGVAQLLNCLQGDRFVLTQLVQKAGSDIVISQQRVLGDSPAFEHVEKWFIADHKGPPFIYWNYMEES